MKKMYKEYFHIPEEGKMREKVFVTRILVAVLGILVWMSAMGFTAYAYFTSSITSSLNTIVAATYSTEIIVIDSTTQEKLLEQTPKEDSMASTFQLKTEQNVPKTYTVTIKALGNAKHGYCKMQIIGADDKVIDEYYTISISQGTTLSFAFECYESTKIRIVTNWGSCSVADSAKIIKQSDIITIGNPTSLIEVPDNASESESQQTSETITTSIGETGTQDSSSGSSESTEKTDGTDLSKGLDNDAADGADADDGNSGDTVSDENISE